MKANEKAKELVDRFCKHKSDDYPNSDEDYHAKQCALICVDEIINTGINQDYIWKDGYLLSLVEFYTEVKQEIKKL